MAEDERQALRAKIGAARLALDAAPNALERSILSRSHSLAITDYVGRLSQSLEPDCVISLQLLAMKAQWNQDDLLQVTSAIAKPTGKTRRHSQDYRALALYLDKQRWDILLSKQDAATKDLSTLKKIIYWATRPT